MNEYRIDGLTIREHLMRLCAESSRKFTENLHPGVENILGIKVPELRMLGKRIATDNWKAYLESAQTFYMEERMLTGMVVGYIKVTDADEYLRYVDDFVKIINCWSVCDSFDFSGKNSFVNRNKTKIWDYLNHYMDCDKEYGIRFGITMGQKYYIDAEYVERYLNKLVSITHEGYYVRMAKAWAISTCYIKFPEITYKYLQERKFDEDTLHKAIQKICDSFRVSDDDKTAVKSLRRKSR